MSSTLKHYRFLWRNDENRLVSQLFDPGPTGPIHNVDYMIDSRQVNDQLRTQLKSSYCEAS